MYHFYKEKRSKKVKEKSNIARPRQGRNNTINKNNNTINKNNNTINKINNTINKIK